MTDLFEEHRRRLHAVAYRLLGSASEADDAVQEAWLRANAADTRRVENPAAWLTTVVSRVSLNMLRDRARRDTRTAPASPAARGPEDEAVLADSVGLAMLVVLDRLTPAERLAFVLHDMFEVPFDQIAPIVDRTPTAARQLASRARRRAKGAPVPDADAARRSQVVDAYLAACRAGDFAALLGLLAPDVALRADAAAGPTPTPVQLRGVRAVARGALMSADRARLTEPVLVDGAPGLAMAALGRLSVVLAFTIADGKITAIDVVAEPQRLGQLELRAWG